MGELSVNIDSLSQEQRLDLLERLWESLSQNPAGLPLTDAQRNELDRRAEALDRDVKEGRTLGVPWDEVVRQIRNLR